MTTTRRGFLGAAATTLGASLVTGCSERLPRYLVPSATPSDDAMPGIARYYRTTCRGCTAGCGATARVRDGRVISLEGNPEHPLSRGALCPQGLAAVEGLYAPDRLAAPRAGGRDISWEQADRALVAGLRQAQTDKKLIVVMSRPERGSLGNVLRAWLVALGQQPNQLVTFEPLAAPWQREGARRAFGTDTTPVHDLAAARFLLSVGDDFVEEGSPVEDARGLADMRAAGGRFVYVGPRLSLTAVAADEWLSVTPGTEAVLVLGLARAVLDLAGPGAKALAPDVLAALRTRLSSYDASSVVSRTGLTAEAFRKLVDGFAHASPSLCVGPGRAVAGDNAATLAEAVGALNAVAGNLGSTLRYEARSQEAWAGPSMDLAELVRRAAAGEVGALLVHHANPLAFGAAFGALRAALARVPFVVSFTNYLDDTARKAHLVLADHHFLEAWSDDTPRAGVTGIQQAAMTPLLPTRAAADVLLAAARTLGVTAGLPAGPFADSVRASFDAAAIEHGGRFAKTTAEPVALSVDALAKVAPFSLAGPADGLPLVVGPTLRHPGGLIPQGDLLQEIPDTLTRISWSGWVEVHPATAAKLGVQTGNLVTLDAGPGRTEPPAYVTPGMREGLVSVPIGYAAPLFEDRPGPPLAFATRVQVRATGRKAALFPMNDRSQHRRPLARSVPHSSPKLPILQPNPSMYPPVNHPNHRWGMGIDLDRCTGCGTCVAACYVENNNAIVGAVEISRGRDLSWLHVQSFIDTTKGIPEVSFIPVGCQHCENAPCEQVCPAYATYHTEEGLNAMVYSRCVGTRYCENNCPYSARSFNFFDHPRPARVTMGLNPDVTVRERGVTEKCTFCIQRIRAAEEQSKFEGRPVRDGEIVPACVGACPTRAMVFGDLKDPKTEVSRWAADGRAYHLLEELNTKPGVVYLARRRDDKAAEMTEAIASKSTSGAPSAITQIERDTIDSMTRTSGYYWAGLAASMSLMALGGWAWSRMLKDGLGLTGLNDTVMWGSLITTFVFFIGVSHSGTLVSAILFFTRSPLRAAVGRSAEAMTVIAILTAGLYPVIHLGRAWLAFFLLPYPNQRGLWPNVRSPLVWDVFAVCSYVTVSALFLYMGMLPDFAVLSKRVKGWRRPLYKVLSLGFSGTDGEWGLFEKAYPIFAGIVIPLAVSVHSVVSWDFAMTLMPGWHSAIFPPYFVAGAIFSGIAMAILLLGGLRKGYKLERYIKIEHFDLLAKLMLGMSVVMTFVYATEFFMAFYRGSETEMELFHWRATGTYAPVFWLVVLFNSVAPLVLFWKGARRHLPTLVVLSIMVTIGMWFERFMFIVSTLAHQYDPYAWRNYSPTLLEACICLGGFGMFLTLFLLFIKLLPSMSIAETMEAEHAAAAHTPADPATATEVTHAA